MGIKLYAEPQVSPVSWQDFLNTAPKYSIALDGYVIGESKFDSEKCIANFNHHENVNRLATKATCAQVLLAIRMKLLDRFVNPNNEIEMNIFTNDCDEDVCLSYYLLKNGYMAECSVNPNLNRLVSIEEVLDSTSGAYPIHKDSPILKELAWIFEPYYRVKFNGLLASKKPDICAGVITDVEHRISAYLLGKGEKVNIDTRYNTIGGGKGWKLVEEIGIHSRTGMMSDGINCFVAARPRNNGKWDYVIGKTSMFIASFDLPTIFETLNTFEGCKEDRWGGSDIIGGSPRVGGSSLSPAEVENLINSME